MDINTRAEKQKFRFPKIGMRIIKTTIAVGLCLFFSYILNIQEPPLIATICAIICMQQRMSDSMEMSFIRTFGTATGAIIGFLTVCGFGLLNTENVALYYSVITLMIVPVFYVSLLLNQAETGALSAIVFLCIVIADSANASPLIGAINRTFETLMGVSISLAVNRIHLPRRNETDFLFITKLDQVLYKQDVGISRFSLFQLDSLLKNDVPITVVTGRTPAFLHEHLDDVKFNLPVIAMDGAVLYDMKTKHYLICREIYLDLAKKILKRLDEMDLNYYVNSVFQDVMYTHHKEFKNKEESRVYKNIKNSPHRHYVYGQPNFIGKIVCISLIIPVDICNEVERIIQAMDKKKQLILIKDGLGLSDEYSHLKIYDSEATKHSMVSHLIERTPQRKSIVFGGNHNDRQLMKYADYAYAIESSPQKVKGVSDGRIKGDDDIIGDKVLKMIYDISTPLTWKKLPKNLQELKLEIQEEDKKLMRTEEDEWDI